jgi:hypothetical protein
VAPALGPRSRCGSAARGRAEAGGVGSGAGGSGTGAAGSGAGAARSGAGAAGSGSRSAAARPHGMGLKVGGRSGAHLGV